MRLSAVTGVNRTKVYRLIGNLEKRSLVVRSTDDRGTFLVAADPATLEVAIVTQEEKIKQQRAIFTQMLPALTSLKAQDGRTFVVRTHEGIEGLKQMCWNELKARGELLSFGGQTVENLILNHPWAEKHRQLRVDAGCRIREIINHDIDLPPFTNNKEFMSRYRYRQIHSKRIYFNEQIIIYNDTVAVYHWRENQNVGVEIINHSYANLMRNIFEHFWQIAKEANKIGPSPL